MKNKLKNFIIPMLVYIKSFFTGSNYETMKQWNKNRKIINKLK